MHNDRQPGWDEIRAVALAGLLVGPVLFLVAILLHKFGISFGLDSVGALVTFVSAPLFVIAVVLRDATKIVENRGRFDLRGLLIFMTLVALALLLFVSHCENCYEISQPPNRVVGGVGRGRSVAVRVVGAEPGCRGPVDGALLKFQRIQDLFITRLPRLLCPRYTRPAE